MDPHVRWHLSVSLALLIGSGSAWGLGEAGTPQQDIVAVEARVPLSSSEVPGLVDGAGLMDRLRGVEQILEAGVTDAARQELQVAIDRIEAIRGDAMGNLPASYSVAGELWLPVRADWARVRLDAPDVQARPPRRGQSTSDNLVAGARIIDWLPLDGTQMLLDDALQQLSGGQDTSPRVGESVAAAISRVRRTTRFADPVLLDTYYAVEAALKAGDTWQPQVQEGLRRDVKRLSARDDDGKLASQLQAVTNASSPERESLLSVAGALRARIEESADSPTGQEALPAAPGSHSEGTFDPGAIPTHGGKP